MMSQQRHKVAARWSRDVHQIIILFSLNSREKTETTRSIKRKLYSLISYKVEKSKFEMAETASKKPSKIWKEECGFPNFEILCVENQNPPPWFIELLITAFIDDYEKVTDFQNIMKQWTKLENDERRNATSALFSTNSVAFPYLSMGFNVLLKKNDGEHFFEGYKLRVERCYYTEYVDQKSCQAKALSPRNVNWQSGPTIQSYASKKVDLAAMLQGTFGRALYALSIFRKGRTNDFPPVTGENVKSFLEKVFATNEQQKNEESHALFFEAVKSFDEASNKEEKFLEDAFKSIKHLYGFPDFLIELKGYIHDLSTFIKFAKENESLVKPIAKMELQN